MSDKLYKGYIVLDGKSSVMTYKNKTSAELLTLEQAKHFPSYGGVLMDNTILIDIDDFEQSEILFDLVRSQQLQCKVFKTNKGKHFVFKIDRPLPNRTKVRLAVGLTADIKGCSSASYQVLRLDGVDREVLYDTGEYQLVPKYLTPIKTNMDVIGMSEGDGRNNALFSYILPLSQNGFTKEECRECITLINEYVLEEPLSDDELSVVLREGAFAKPVFFNSRGTFLFDKFATYLKDVENIIKINGKLFIYREGIYECSDEVIEAAMIRHIPTLTRQKRQEVLAYLNLLVTQESRVHDANLIAFNNGVFDVTTDEFMEFSPEYIITNKIPHDYNPNAHSELLDKVMNKLACGDEVVNNLLYQAVGYCFYRRNELRKSFFLLGEKRNGKSTFLDMITTLFGDLNTSNLDLCEIGHQFRTAELSGKLVNVGDDINDEWVSNTAIFKKVVSGDIITVERKGKDPFKLRSYAKFFFSANALPRLGRGRDSKAILDRLVIIPFDAKFSKDDADYDPFIKYKLRSEEVMQALILKGLRGLKTLLINQEFDTCQRVFDTLAEFEISNNPLLAFFEELDIADYSNQPIKSVYQKYVGYCISSNLQAKSALEFQKMMKDHFQLVIKTVEVNNRRVRIYSEC